MKYLVRLTAGAKCVLVALHVLSISGCGYQAIQQEQFAVRSAWSEVMVAYKEKGACLSWLAAVLKNGDIKNAAAGEMFLRSLAAINELNGKTAVAADPRSFMVMRSLLQQLDDSGRNLLKAAVVLNSSAVRADAVSLDKLVELPSAVHAVDDRIRLARERYDIAVTTYNTVISVKPAEMIASFVGATPLPTFDSAYRPDGSISVFTVNERLIGH